jgi:hypothetical protein
MLPPGFDIIKKVADNLWLAEDDKFSVGGLQIGSRMRHNGKFVRLF